MSNTSRLQHAIPLHAPATRLRPFLRPVASGSDAARVLDAPPPFPLAATIEALLSTLDATQRLVFESRRLGNDVTRPRLARDLDITLGRVLHCERSAERVIRQHVRSAHFASFRERTAEILARVASPATREGVDVEALFDDVFGERMTPLQGAFLLWLAGPIENPGESVASAS